MKLLFASQNQGKVKEAKEILRDLKFKILDLDDFPELVNLKVKETGKTLEANALLKAKFFAKKTGLVTIADDSGIFTEAFPNFPGVNSNRWKKGTDSQKNIALIKKLKKYNNKKVEFRTTLCLYYPKEKRAEFFEGIVCGHLAEKEIGDKGFGYDPIFIPDGFDKTFAELGLEAKNKFSHRKKALEEMKKFLSK
jgi:XTP/dITP diphosphohydrolase